MIQGSCLCGAVRWRLDGMPEGATACNCTACRRYGALWAYDCQDEGIHVTGPTTAFVRDSKVLAFQDLPGDGRCVVDYWF